MKKNKSIPEDKQQLLLQWQKSGKGMQSFCKESGLPYYSLQYWHRKQKRGGLSKMQGSFIKIPAPIKNEMGVEKLSEIIYSNGNRIVFYSNRKITELKQLVH